MAVDKVNISVASTVCGVRRGVIERLLRHGGFPGAVRGDGVNGVWLIPVEDLPAAGLSVDRTALRRYERSLRRR